MDASLAYTDAGMDWRLWTLWRYPSGLLWMDMQRGTPWSEVARGWFTQAYPDLFPYHALPTAESTFVHPWLYSPYEGYWW